MTGPGIEEARDERGLPPRLAEIARGALAGFRAATDVLRESTPRERPIRDLELAGFAHDARALLGHEQLPDPIAAWATMSPEGEPGLRRPLPGAKLEMRRWEGKLTLFRRQRTGKAGVEDALARVLGSLPRQREPLVRKVTFSAEAEAPPAPHDVLEWHGSFRGGRFDRIVAAFDGRTLLFALTPALSPPPVDSSHESPEQELLDAASARARPPSARALPSPLAMPCGGRQARKPRPVRRRPLR